MNNRKPARKFSGDKKRSDEKDKSSSRQERKEHYTEGPKRRASYKDSHSDSDKPRRSSGGYQKKEGNSKPRSFSRDEHKGDKKKSDSDRNDKPRRNFSKDRSEKNSGGYRNDKPKRDSDSYRSDKFADRPKRNFSKDQREKNSDSYRNDKPKRTFSGDSERNSDSYRNDKPKRNFSGDEKKSGERTFDKDHSEKPRRRFEKGYPEKKYDKDKKFYKKDFSKKKEVKPTFAEQGLTRLNKYISNAGICSRREADDLIKSGCVTVNGKVISELGFKVKAGDEVNYSGTNLKTEKHVYILLNKPKDYLTTVTDDRGRRTVMELLAGACKERVYPVGRLDRNTTGLLLFTNDGEMTKKLTHPKHGVQKLYHVELDKNLKQTDLVKIREGIELEDGPIKPDEISYAGETKREVGIEIHSGRNRIVRRIFETLGYEVLKLDRVMFAGLTKKNLPKGRWRFLTDQEVSFLKMV